MKPIEAAPEEQASIKASTKRHIEAVLLDMARKHDMQPISSACTMTDGLIFSVAAIDKAAAIDYFRATLDAVETRGTPAEEEAYQRRDAAFDRLARAVMLLRVQPEGLA